MFPTVPCRIVHPRVRKTHRPVRRICCIGTQCKSSIGDTHENVCSSGKPTFAETLPITATFFHTTERQLYFDIALHRLVDEFLQSV